MCEAERSLDANPTYETARRTLIRELAGGVHEIDLTATGEVTVRIWGLY
jgi:hypothetical protein